MVRKIGTLCAILLLSVLAVSCKSKTSNSLTVAASSYQSAGPFKEILDNGLGKYIGQPEVSIVSSEPLTGSEIMVHKFPTEGRFPSSMTGDPFHVQTREGSGSELLIYFQGGGVCGSLSCFALNFPAGLSDRLPDIFDTLGGALSTTDASNPFQNYDLVHAAYSDGSLMMGDIDNQSRPNAFGKMININHRGILNLTATLEVAKKVYPNPSRIVVAGSSAGSLASIAGAMMARTYYPNHEISVVFDAGIGVVNGEDKNFMLTMAESMGFLDLITLNSCPECITNGHATNIIRWLLDTDPSISVAFISSTEDHVISSFALNPSATSSSWKSATVSEMTAFTQEYPDRAKVFLVPGTEHTFLMMGGSTGLFVENIIASIFNEDFELTPFFDGALSFVSNPFIVGDKIGEIVGSPNFSLGSMDSDGTNMKGEKVLVRDFVTQFLQDPKATSNVINVD